MVDLLDLPYRFGSFVLEIGMPFFLMKMEFAKFSHVYVESHDKSLFGHELLNDIA